MNEPDPVRPKGVTSYDLLGMGDEDFESMNALLIKLEFPSAFKPANTNDGGADMVLASDGRYERCWQSKHFTGSIGWTKCQKSLADAREHWDPAHYTFCFARDLTIKEQTTFDKHFRGPDAEVEVDHWNGNALQGKLVGSDGGQRIARQFFDDVQFYREDTNRAIEAGGRLTTPEDAVDHLSNLGGFLATKDAYFSYPAATHEASGPAPPLTPGAVMSYGKSDGTVTTRIDLVPRDSEAMERYGPAFTLQPTEGEEGQRAAARLQAALQEGKGVEIEEGLDFTFTRLPPGFEHIVGQRLAGTTMKFGTPEVARGPIPPWNARLHVATDAGETFLDVALQPQEPVPAEWEHILTGTHGGLNVTVLFRWRAEGGEIRWTFRHARDASPVREQLKALSFLHAMSDAAEVVISDRGPSGRGEMRVPIADAPLSGDSLALLAFLEDVRAIEKWAGVEYTLPDTVSGHEAWAVAEVAAAVRNHGLSVTWRDMVLTVEEDGLAALRDGKTLRVERTLSTALLGRHVELGRTHLAVADYVVSSVEWPEGQAHASVRIEPGTVEAADLFEELVRPAGSSRRPPPPPPRQGNRKRAGKRKKRGKRRR